MPQPPASRPPAGPASSVPSVRAVQRAAAILSSFIGRPPLALAEIAAATGLDKGTVRRMLLTLIAVRFVAQDQTTQRYRLGQALRDLGAAVTDELDLRAVATPALSELAALLQMTVFLSVYDDRGAVCLARFHGETGMEVRWWRIGGTLPLNCGGAPKLLLAYQPRTEIDKVLARPMAALTRRSIVTPGQLRRHLALVAKRGWELAVDDVVIGLSALAVPLRDVAGHVVGSISLAGLTPQLVRRGRPVHLAQLQAVAATVSGHLR